MMPGHFEVIDNERVLNHTDTRQGTVFAFDFGERRIGIAVGEILIKSVSPLGQIDTESNEVRFKLISEHILEWQPTLLIVGMPFNLAGEETPLCQLCRKFARRLNGRFNLPVILVDERFSSHEASEKLNQQGIKGQAQKEMLDQLAATTILQRYFDYS